MSFDEACDRRAVRIELGAAPRDCARNARAGARHRDVYARAHCRGEQPRFVVRAAFDFTLWMALLSGSPIPVPAR